MLDRLSTFLRNILKKKTQKSEKRNVFFKFFKIDFKNTYSVFLHVFLRHRFLRLLLGFPICFVELTKSWSEFFLSPYHQLETKTQMNKQSCFMKMKFSFFFFFCSYLKFHHEDSDSLSKTATSMHIFGVA